MSITYPPRIITRKAALYNSSGTWTNPGGVIWVRVRYRGGQPGTSGVGAGQNAGGDTQVAGGFSAKGARNIPIILQGGANTSWEPIYAIPQEVMFNPGGSFGYIVGAVGAGGSATDDGWVSVEWEEVS